MKHPTVSFLLLLFVAIALFVFGMYIYLALFLFFEPEVEGIEFKITNLGRYVNTSYLFAFVLALSPVLVFFTWKKGTIVSLAGNLFLC